jgi:hypothetical protein
MNKLHAAGPHTQALFHVALHTWERTLDARSIVRFCVVSPLDRVNRVGIIRFETVAARGAMPVQRPLQPSCLATVFDIRQSF